MLGNRNRSVRMTLDDIRCLLCAKCFLWVVSLNTHILLKMCLFICLFVYIFLTMKVVLLSVELNVQKKFSAGWDQAVTVIDNTRSEEK